MRVLRLALAAALAASPLLAAPAFADEEDDELDDLLKDVLNDQKQPQSVAEEKKDLLAGKVDDGSDVVLPEELERRRRLIKTLQKKTFLKLGRYEVTPKLGAVANDPYIKRYLLGVDATAHLTEIFAIEANATFSPDFGVADWKPITDQLVNENRVSPSISKIIFFSSVGFQFAPIYGKVALSSDKIINFDVYGTVGSGVVYTKDDLRALQAEGEPAAIATEAQIHPTMNMGGGVRVVLPDSNDFAIRVEGRSLVYIETLNSLDLQYKNNLLFNAGFSFFFPNVE